MCDPFLCVPFQYNFSHGDKKIKMESDATKALLRLQVSANMHCVILCSGKVGGQQQFIN